MLELLPPNAVDVEVLPPNGFVLWEAEVLLPPATSPPNGFVLCDGFGFPNIEALLEFVCLLKAFPNPL